MTAKPTRKHDWWLYAVLALALLQVALFVVLKARPGKVGVLLWSVGPLGLGFLAVALLIVALAWSAVRRPFWTSRLGIGYVALAFVLTVSAKAYRVYPSSHDAAPSQVEFRLPLDGPVTVAWGGATMDVNYHVRAPDQRWAYDLLVTKDGRSFTGSGGHLEDYYAFGLPVLAPAAGTVYSILDGKPDQPIGTKWIGKDWAGNHVVLDIAPGEFLFIAHLEAGTLTVEPGDRVQAGQELGRVGNSGRSTEPHVHVHLQDTPQLHVGEGIPVYFHRYREGDKLVGRGMPTGGMAEHRFVGQVIEHVGQQPHTLPTAPSTSLNNHHTPTSSMAAGMTNRIQ